MTSSSVATRFIWPLLIGNLILISMYFSGSKLLQYIVAPPHEMFPYFQSREYGLLELIQNFLLLAVIVLFLISTIKRKDIIEKLFFTIGLAAFTFLFLEEIDYGLHYYSLLIGENIQPEIRNWHNQWDENGIENATVMKKYADLANIFWFVLIPLLSFIKPIREKLKHINNSIPSRWFIISCLIAVMCSRLAHFLDDAGYAVINGFDGSMHGAIGEFREASFYYLYLLYALQLFNCRQLFSPSPNNDD